MISEINFILEDINNKTKDPSELHFKIKDINNKELESVLKKDYNIEEQFEISGQAEELGETSIDDVEKMDIDTLVCSAKEDGFNRAFMKKKAWWAVRLRAKMIPHIKYIAIYQVAPISKITYYGKVDHFEPYEDSGKYILYLEGKPIKLEQPVGLGNNPHLKPQGHKYTKLEKIKSAKTLDDIFG
jgi:hypothetical protein